jgi:hypothetical protein
MVDSLLPSTILFLLGLFKDLLDSILVASLVLRTLGVPDKSI